MPDENTPTYPDPWVGWKTWSVGNTAPPPKRRVGHDPWAIRSQDQMTNPSLPESDGQFVLVSGGNIEWPAREKLIAACRAGRDHRSPDPGCRCGIYAAKTHSVLRARGYAAGPDDERHPDLVGELWMWGLCMESDDILRAEFAYPKRLFIPHRSWQWAKPLKELYGVPVVLKNPFTMSTEEEPC